MSSYDNLVEKVENEMKSFKASYENMSPTQVYNDWYIIGFKEEFYEMLTSDFTKESHYAESLVWLSSFENPLQFLYDQWLSCDGAFNHDWDEMLDWINSIYENGKEVLLDQVDSLYLKCNVSNTDKYFDSFAYACNISNNPIVIDNKAHDCVMALSNKFKDFFREKVFVKSCDYGCDTYPGGVTDVVGSEVYTFQPKVWNFIKNVEQMFDCKCSYPEDYNGFQFAFEFGENENKGCYVLAAGNNGQEYTETLYFQNPEQIHNADFVKAVTTIDRALYLLLEGNGLRQEETIASLDAQIQSATIQASKSHNSVKEKENLPDAIR